VQFKALAQIVRATDVIIFAGSGPQHINVVHNYFTGQICSPTDKSCLDKIIPS
jgi:hypothetical protein